MVASWRSCHRLLLSKSANVTHLHGIRTLKSYLDLRIDRRDKIEKRNFCQCHFRHSSAGAHIGLAAGRSPRMCPVSARLEERKSRPSKKTFSRSRTGFASCMKTIVSLEGSLGASHDRQTDSVRTTGKSSRMCPRRRLLMGRPLPKEPMSSIIDNPTSRFLRMRQGRPCPGRPPSLPRTTAVSGGFKLV